MVYKLFFGALASARNGLGEDQGKKQRSQSMAKEPATATSRKGMAAWERPITNRRVVTTDANPTNPKDCRVAALATGGRRRLGLPLGWSTGKPKRGTAGWVAQRGYSGGAWGTERRMPGRSPGGTRRRSLRVLRTMPDCWDRKQSGVGGLRPFGV